MEEKFFNTHRSNDATEKALISYLQRVNNQKHFVEQTAKQIGYPRWDKMLASKKNDNTKAGRNSSADSTYIYNIPFVRENENYVNASLNLKITGTDTTFGYSCDWQYQNKVHGSPNVDSTAERHALYFMILDHLTLGHIQFTLLDSNLFPTAANVTSANRRIGIGTTAGKYVGRSSEMQYFNYCENLYHCGAPTSLDCRNGCDFLHCKAPANSPLYCYGIQVCYDGWYDDGNNGGDSGGYEGEGSGAGGNGGSGSGGGGTPPNCTPGHHRSAQYPPCEPGWEPEYVGDEPDYNPNNYDTIGITQALKSTYPCFANFLKDTLPNTNGFTQRILYNLFGVSSRIHLTYDIDFHLTKDSADALTDPTQIRYDPAVNPRVYKFSTTIRLNPWLLDSASHEYNVATAIHEGIHAFIDQMFTQIYITDPATITNYFSLFLYYYTQNQNYTNPTLQHYEIASKYLDSITNVVKHYYRGVAPNEQWKDSVSRALAWGGLSTTNVWTAMPSYEKCRIASINLAARDISSQGGIINIPGITCGLFPNSRFDSLKLSLPCY